MSNAKRSFVIGDRYEQFIEAQLASGRFNNASEVVRAGLRLLEDREAELAELRALIAEGDEQLERGEGVVIRSIEEYGRQIVEEGMKRLSREN
ncbi:MAG: type II toxin-antitoxin system ParD family antitoxin [Pararhizobium sp.]